MSDMRRTLLTILIIAIATHFLWWMVMLVWPYAVTGVATLSFMALLYYRVRR